MCKHCLKCKDCKKCKGNIDGPVEWCKTCKKFKEPDYYQIILESAKKYMSIVIVVFNTKSKNE